MTTFERILEITIRLGEISVSSNKYGAQLDEEISLTKELKELEILNKIEKRNNIFGKIK
jgi:hypothetical protein